jgi:hypothetical protein
MSAPLTARVPFVIVKSYLKRPSRELAGSMTEGLFMVPRIGAGVKPVRGRRVPEQPSWAAAHGPLSSPARGRSEAKQAKARRALHSAIGAAEPVRQRIVRPALPVQELGCALPSSEFSDGPHAADAEHLSEVAEDPRPHEICPSDCRRVWSLGRPEFGEPFVHLGQIGQQAARRSWVHEVQPAAGLPLGIRHRLAVRSDRWSSPTWYRQVGGWDVGHGAAPVFVVHKCRTGELCAKVSSMPPPRTAFGCAPPRRG